MRIIAWSSDVCSSDLRRRPLEAKFAVDRLHLRRAVAVVIAGARGAGRDAASAVGAGLDVELAGTVGKGGAVAGDGPVEESAVGGGAQRAERAPGRAGAGAVERRDIGEGCARHIAAPVDIGGIVLVAQI